MPSDIFLVIERALRHYEKRVREQPVPGQHGLPLAVLRVVAGLAAPHGGVVHAGQVVVYQGVGVYHLQAARYRHGLVCLAAEHFDRGEQHAGPQALAFGKQAVAHRFAKDPRRLAGLERVFGRRGQE
jgi:hypothetical protein